jgi:hypothetical protein
MFFILPVMFQVMITMALDGMMTNVKILVNSSQLTSTGSKLLYIIYSEIQKKEDLVHANISISGLFLIYFSSINRGVAKSGYGGATGI